jgi:hypothetical protein
MMIVGGMIRHHLAFGIAFCRVSDATIDPIEYPSCPTKSFVQTSRSTQIPAGTDGSRAKKQFLRLSFGGQIRPPFLTNVNVVLRGAAIRFTTERWNKLFY